MYHPTFTVEQPGWSQLLDPWRCPVLALPYLAQYVGVSLDRSLSEQGQREQVIAAAGMRRGRPASIVAAGKLWLNGSKTLTLVERYQGSAYALKVHVHASEVIDSAKFMAAVTGAVPAGIVLTIDVGGTWNYEQWENAVSYADTWLTLEGGYAGITYAALENHVEVPTWDYATMETTFTAGTWATVEDAYSGSTYEDIESEEAA